MSFQSPGTYAREFDFSDYVQKAGYTILAIVGAASKGPLNTPIYASNEADLVRKCGKPLLDEYGIQSGIQFLKRGDQLIFVRVANGAITANYPVPGLAGGTAAVKASGTIAFVGNNNPADGDTITLANTVATADVEADVAGAAGNAAMSTSGSGGLIVVSGLSGGTATTKATGTIKLLGVPADGATVTVSDGSITKVFEFDNNSSVSGSNTAVTIVTGDPYATLTNLIVALNAAAFACSASDNVMKQTFEFDNNASYDPANRPVLIGATALDTMVSLISAISQSGLAVSPSNTTVTVPQATITATVAGAAGNSLILKNGTNISVNGLAGGTDAIAGAVSTVMTMYASSPGTWGNATRIKVRPTVMLSQPAGRFDLEVYSLLDDGSGYQLVERFMNLSLDATSERYVTTILRDGKRGEVSASEYVTADVITNAGSVAAGTYDLGTAPGVTGTDGVTGLTASHYIGSGAGAVPTGLQALRNPETTRFNLLAIPGVSDATVIDAVKTMAEKRGDFLALIDTPFGLKPQEVVDWHNGLSSIVPNAPTGAIDSNYLAIYWAWVEITDSYNNRNVWVPPSGLVAAAMAKSDVANGPWWTVAGHVRGLINGNRVEDSPWQDDRDLLVGDPNRINPIVNFQNGGLTIYGNRTTQRRLTSLNNVHTRRMLIYAKDVCTAAVRVLQFDPNDSHTWIRFSLLVQKELDRIKAGRGVEDFRVICDASTNPPEQRQRKMMRGKILLRAMEAAEIIVMDFGLTAAGSEFNDNLL